MVSYRLDFLDKLVISITFVIVTFICIFNTFCFASTQVSGTEVSNLSISYPAVPNGTFSYFEGAKGICFEVVPGHSYEFTCNVTTSRVFSDVFPSDGEHFVGSLYYPSVGTTYKFTADSSYVYIYFSNQSGTVDSQTVFLIDVTPVGLTYAINELVQNVGISNIWNTFDIALPFVLVVVVISFGFYIIFTMIKKFSKGNTSL